MMNSAENPSPLTNEQRWKQEKSDAKVGDCKGHDKAVRC